MLEEKPYIEEDILGQLRKGDLGKKKKVKRERKEIKKVNWKAILLTSILLSTVIVSVTMYAVERYADWRKYYAWQTPIRWVGFIIKIEKPVKMPEGSKKIEEKKLTDMQILDQYKLAPYLKSIYMLESTKGKNDWCKEQGKFNGFGYRQNTREKKCFDSFDKVAGFVNEWLEDRLSTNGNDIIEAVCYYNQGIAGMSSCTYSQNFVSVLTDNL